MRAALNPLPSVSVVIVSDHGAIGPEGWSDIRRALSALSDQDFRGPAEFLVCESERSRGQLPSDLTESLPSTRLCFFPEVTSYELKNRGVETATAEFVALLDADCQPDRSWLGRMVRGLRERPTAAAISGITLYRSDSVLVRTCALLGRSYVDPGRAGPTRFIAINNCAFRREAYLDCPLPTGIGTFSSRLQSEALRRAGWELLFDPDIRAIHDFDGWAMEADFRRNCGHGTIKTRLEDDRLPYAWLARLGWLGIPPILIGKILNSWADCARCHHHYGLRWYAVPGAMLASVAVHMLEITGMVQAFREGGLEDSAFR